jgi:kumamolisin
MAETDYPTSYLESESAAFKAMAAAGMSVFAASGDAGAFENTSVNTPTVADPASQPYVVAVGGTRLSTNSSGKYLSETTWNDGSAEAGASGGGISEVWAQPSWQSGITLGQNKASASMRNLPDVSLNADPSTGYSIYLNGAWSVYGGTSCATPIWAAFTAVVNQARATSGLSVLGFPNPYLYRLGQNATRSGSDFHDISDSSWNLFYSALTGFDDATGWGSLNGGGMFQDLTTEPTIAADQTTCPTGS